MVTIEVTPEEVHSGVMGAEHSAAAGDASSATAREKPAAPRMVRGWRGAFEAVGTTRASLLDVIGAAMSGEVALL